MPPVFSKAVGAILLGARVRAVGLGHVEIGLRAIAREPEVGVVEHGEQLTAGDPIAFVPQHALEARGNLGHDGDLGARIERAGQRQRLGQVARLARSPCAPERCATVSTAGGVFCLGSRRTRQLPPQPMNQNE